MELMTVHLLKKTGRKIKLIDNSYDNIKITTKEDLIFAKAILRKKDL